MMATFTEFLKQKAAQHAAESEKSKVIVEEWQEAVEKLFTKLEVWLDASDSDGIIKRERSRINVTEPGVGRYSISRLDLQAFGKWVGVIPKARKTVKRASPQQNGAPEQATGRVDITDEIRRFVLYRFSQGEGERWFIHDTATSEDLQPLTAELFEAALMGYFQ